MRKLIACGVALVAALALTVPGALGGAEQTPGVTAKQIVIGGTFPLTGPAAAYAPIPLGMKAYFSHINARRGPDGKRGVMGRQIVWKYYDDGYNPANTVQLTRKLVEEDKVFATVGQLGTEHNLAVRGVPEPGEGAAGARLDRCVVLGHAVQGVPVDDRLAAGLHRRGPYLRPAHQGEPQRQEDRDPLPERRLRQGLPVRPSGRAREGLRRSEHRRHGGGRGRLPRARRRRWPRSRQRERAVLVILQIPTPTVRSIATGKALGYNPDQIYMNSVSAFRTPMDARGRVGRSAVRQRDPFRRVPEGLGQPEVGQRRGDEAVPRDRREVSARAELERRSDLLRRGEGRDLRAGAVQGREEPDPRRSHECAPELELGEQVPAPGRHAEDHEEDHWVISQMQLQRFNANDKVWVPVGRLIDGRPR